MHKIVAVDLFCGAGGLTHGFKLEGIPIAAGIDVDPICRFPYEANNKTRFIEKDINKFSIQELQDLYQNAKVKILAGCAPCQPFSTYTRGRTFENTKKWRLLENFIKLIEGTMPDVITMENVPTLQKHEIFNKFVNTLKKLKYYVWYGVIDCSQYGVPQTRQRIVLFASKFCEFKIIPPTHKTPKTVRETIGELSSLLAGECSVHDKLHIASGLSSINFKRIQASKPGGTWRDWPSKLVAKCHKSKSGRGYQSVYGRMEWDKPAPTLTTQCYGFGNGRFGHPEQHRAISLREAALLQGFPENYVFVSEKQHVQISSIGRLIGNAVPVELGRAIAKSIKQHLRSVKRQTINRNRTLSA